MNRVSVLLVAPFAGCSVGPNPQNSPSPTATPTVEHTITNETFGGPVFKTLMVDKDGVRTMGEPLPADECFWDLRIWNGDSKSRRISIELTHSTGTTPLNSVFKFPADKMLQVCIVEDEETFTVTVEVPDVGTQEKFEINLPSRLIWRGETTVAVFENGTIDHRSSRLM